MKTRYSSSWDAGFLITAPVLLLLALVSCAGAGCRGNASGASGSTTGTPAQSESPLLRLHGEIPPEMGLRFELTFKATANARDCKKRSLVDGEFYPIEKKRQIEHDPESATYRIDVPLGWGEKSECRYRVSMVGIGFKSEDHRETGGKIYITTPLQSDTTGGSQDNVPLPKEIAVFCQTDVENLVWAPRPLECDNVRALNSTRSKQIRSITHHADLSNGLHQLELNVRKAS